MLKVSKRTKLKIGKVISFLMYSIGAGVAIAYAECIGQQDGYEMGFRHAKELSEIKVDKEDE